MTLLSPGVSESERNLKTIKWSVYLLLPLEKPNKIKLRSKVGARWEHNSTGLKSAPPTLLCTVAWSVRGTAKKLVSVRAGVLAVRREKQHLLM